jgi:hypothetical protein
MFRKLDLFPSSGDRVGEPILLGPVERANLNHWTMYVRLSTTTYIPEITICQQEITQKFAVKILILHIQS